MRARLRFTRSSVTNLGPGASPPARPPPAITSRRQALTSAGHFGGTAFPRSRYSLRRGVLMRLLGRLGDQFYNRTFCPHTPGPPAHHPSHSGRQLGYASLNRACAVGVQVVRQRPQPDTAGALRERRELAMCRPNERPAGLISRPTPCGMRPRLHARQRARPDRRQAVRAGRSGRISLASDKKCVIILIAAEWATPRGAWLIDFSAGLGRHLSGPACNLSAAREFTRSARGQSFMSAAACSQSGRCWVCVVGGKWHVPRRSGAQRAAERMVS